MSKELDEALKAGDLCGRFMAGEKSVWIGSRVIGEKWMKYMSALTTALRSSLSTIRAQEEEIKTLGEQWSLSEKRLNDEAWKLMGERGSARLDLAAMTKERDEAARAWSRAQDQVLKLTNASIRKSEDVLALEASLAALDKLEAE